MPKHRTIVDISEFRARIGRGHKPGVGVRLLGPGPELDAATEDRVVSFVFSDDSVDRYGDRIEARGWQLDNFNANPVALFGHDSGSVENVIGRASNVRVEGNRLVGDIEFMEASVNPNAEVVYQMVKAGYLRAVSVGFQPLDWVAAQDKGRAGGIDFRKQELLEISIVPIPANPTALVQAKAAGIAIERIGLVAPAPIAAKGLSDVSWLASLLNELGWLHDCVAWEAEYEGDGSEVPANLAAAMQALGEVLVSMTAEEVAELLADRIDDEPLILVADDPTEMAALTPAQKAFVKLASLGRRARNFAKRAPAPAIERAGKVLSAANETALREAHDLITKGCGMVKAVFDQATAEDPEPDADDPTKAAAEAQARARRERVAKAHKAKIGDIAA
jgi:HK97 family phage prohead protease